MNSRIARGFTIVELLIVIVVIAILASITVVAYNGIQVRSQNTARAAQLKQVANLMKAYKATNDKYPAMTANTTYCAGTGYPGGKCRNYTSASNVANESDATVSNALKTVGTLPNGGYIPANNAVVGPFVYTWVGGDGFDVSGAFIGESQSDCPGMEVTWNDPDSSTLVCGVSFLY